MPSCCRAVAPLFAVLFVSGALADEARPALPSAALEAAMREQRAGGVVLSEPIATALLHVAARAPAARRPQFLKLASQADPALATAATARMERDDAVSVIPGFGLGHVVQQRWKERGWIFTLGEFAASGFIAAAAAESDLDPSLVGAMAIVGWADISAGACGKSPVPCRVRRGTTERFASSEREQACMATGRL